MTSKSETYQTLLPQIEALMAGEKDMIAKMANICAALHEAFGFWWTGFYRVMDSPGHARVAERPAQPAGKDLVLGPFQGPVACMHIPFGRGVCGTAWQRAETVIVPNVHEFAGHIACSSASNSEIVVPVFSGGNIIAVLDIDSTDFAAFDETDRLYLEQIVQLLTNA